MKKPILTGSDSSCRNSCVIMNAAINPLMVPVMEILTGERRRGSPPAYTMHDPRTMINLPEVIFGNPS